jgi:hypothetical protein
VRKYNDPWPFGSVLICDFQIVFYPGNHFSFLSLVSVEIVLIVVNSKEMDPSDVETVILKLCLVRQRELVSDSNKREVVVDIMISWSVLG